MDYLPGFRVSLSLKPLRKQETLEGTTFKAQVQVLICPNIITKGYKFNLHIDREEYEGEIIKINEKPFIKSYEQMTTRIRIDRKARFNVGARIILRSNDLTIGYGKIIV